jgi:DNA-binding response OmpR family regulator
MATVVIVEDDVALADMYQYRLKAAGYTSIVAYEGVSGLALIEKTKPDIVLLDLMLPNMSGDEVLKAMRKTDWGKDIKVLVLTNISEYEAPVGLEKLGIEGYLVKANYTPKQVMGYVEKVLGPQSTTK